MLLRLLILFIAGILVYRAARLWLGGGGRSAGHVSPLREVDDEMIRDPECGVYFPLRNAVTLSENGRVIRFCSHACRDRYLARRSGEAAS